MNGVVGKMVFVGFNSRVAALNREDGRLLWQWKSPKGGGYVSLLLIDDQHLIVSVQGYTYCLNPANGAQLWFNELSGFGVGVTSLATLGAVSQHHLLFAADANAQAAQSAQTTQQSAAFQPPFST